MDNNGILTITHPLPSEHYSIKIQAQEQLTNSLFELLTSLQVYIIAGQQQMASSVLSLQNHVPGANSPLGKLELAVKVNRAKVEFMERTADHRVAVKALEDMKLNFEHVFKPDNEVKMKAAVEKWDSLVSELANYPEIKAMMDKAIKDREWDINTDEVKLYYSNQANTLISQAKFSASTANNPKRETQNS